MPQSGFIKFYYILKKLATIQNRSPVSYCLEIGKSLSIGLFMASTVAHTIVIMGKQYRSNLNANTFVL